MHFTLLVDADVNTGLWGSPHPLLNRSRAVAVVEAVQQPVTEYTANSTMCIV